MVTASRIFDGLSANGIVHAERHEVVCGWFGNLRSNLRRMARIYHEADDPEASEAIGHIQRMLSEWLTVPVTFDEALATRLTPLGSPDLVERRWGEDLGSLCRAAHFAARQLSGRANPLAALVGERICYMQANNVDFRIFCHRAAVPDFNHLVVAAGGTAVSPNRFLHSWRDYRECALFDTLVKIGPLRANGWGSVPDGIVTAPRFQQLLQFVWSGCDDEPDFGYDPVISSAAVKEISSQILAASSNFPIPTLHWSTLVHGDLATDALTLGAPTDDDEFKIFREFREGNAQENREAVLIQIDDEHAILYPPLSRVLCFDADRADAHCLGYRIAGESLTESCFVIRPSMQFDEGDALQAQHGRFSQIWKSKLRKRLHESSEALICELDAAGLDLVWLGSALHHWVKPPTTVIHAPQQKRHFEILVRVLQADFAPVAPAHFRSKPLWQFAWQEVCNSRGDAIHAGVVSHALGEERLFEVLVSMIPEIRHKAAACTGFTLAVPDSGAEGRIAFFDRVLAIEDGFRVRDQSMRVVYDLNQVEQWRV